MFVLIALVILVLSIVLNILRIYHVKRRGYFLTHKSKKFEKFEEELNDML